MLGRLRSKLTYANVVGTLALFVALGGVGYAASTLPANSVGTKQLRSDAVTNSKLANGTVTGAKVAAGSLTGAQIKSSTLGTVPKATHANTATTANNALGLGGIKASGYARNGCSSQTGQVRGFALVPASSSFSSTFSDLSGAYNCSGQAVQAKRTLTGEYEVKFPGNPATAAVGSINAIPTGPGVGDIVTFERNTIVDDFYVHVRNAAGSAVDVPFAVLVP